MAGDRAEHWQTVYATKAETEVSWFEALPAASLALIARAGVARDAPLLDVGGGAGRLVDALIDRGHTDVAVLDLSAAALALAAARVARNPRAATRLVTAERHDHRTPGGAVQRFQYGLYAAV